jgi:hypothetical protein
MFQEVPLTLPALVGHFSPPADQPDRNGLGLLAIGQNAVVVGDRAMVFEGVWGAFVSFVAVSDLTQATHRQLRRQAKRYPQIRIQRLVELDVVKDLVRPGVVTDQVTRGIGGFKRLLEPFSLFGRGLQFDLRRQFHATQYSTNFKHLKGEKRIPPLPSEQGSLAPNSMNLGAARCAYSFVLTGS